MTVCEDLTGKDRLAFEIIYNDVTNKIMGLNQLDPESLVRTYSSESGYKWFQIVVGFNNDKPIELKDSHILFIGQPDTSIDRLLPRSRVMTLSLEEKGVKATMQVSLEQILDVNAQFGIDTHNMVINQLILQLEKQIIEKNKR